MAKSINTLDLLIPLLGALLFGIGCWLAKTPFDYFVAVVLAVLAPFCVSTLLATAAEIRKLQTEVDKIRQAFGSIIP